MKRPRQKLLFNSMAAKAWQIFLLSLSVALVLRFVPISAYALADQTNQTNALRFTHLRDKQLDSVGFQWVSLQDEQGFMWFGGEHGLVRYDAYKFKLYQNDADNPNSLSGNNVFALEVDAQGNMWVGTLKGANRYNAATDSFTRFVHNPSDPSSIGASDISNILKDSRGHLWFATNGGGLNRFLPSTEEFERVELRANGKIIGGVASLIEDRQGSLWMACTIDQWKTFGLCVLPRAKFGALKADVSFYPYDTATLLSLVHRDLQVYEDSEGQLWVAVMGDGLSHFNRVTTSFVHYRHQPLVSESLGHNEVNHIFEDSHRNFWVGTDKAGLNRLNRDTKQFEHFSHRARDPYSVASDKIHSIYENRFGDLWLGYFPVGLSIRNNYAGVFLNYWNRDDSATSLSDSAVNAIVETAEGNLWVGTEKGLNHINRSSGELTQYVHDPAQALSTSGLTADAVLSLLIDSDGVLWVGTWLGGLSRFNQSEDENIGTFTHFGPQLNRSDSLNDSVVLGLFEDSDKRLWIGTRNGLNQFQPETSTFLRYEHDDSNPDSIMSGEILSMFEDSRGNFWLGSEAGVELMDLEHGTFKHYQHNKTPHSIDEGYVSAIHEDKKGRLWFGIVGAGLNLFDPDTGKVIKKYHREDGLPDTSVKSILEDNRGGLWLSTGYGLSHFQPDTALFRNYTVDHGLAGNIYNHAAYLKTSSGELAFGSSEGLTLFNPENIFKNNVVPPIVITDFHLFHKPVEVGVKNSPLQQSITYMARSADNVLTLNHEQSVFSFEFAALNYQLPHLNQYAYKLDGFDKQWVQSGTIRSATYTNLDPGDYVFRVKGSNNDGLWNELGTAINIRIIPPWWRSWWALSFYILSLLLFFGLIIYSYIQRRRAKVEQRVIEKLQHLDRVKDTFLANTSHELRTPLNGIIGLSDSLIEGVAGPLPQNAQNYLHMIVNSSKRLSHLINDILDFTKLKQETINLDLKNLDLYSQASMVMGIANGLIGAKPLELFNYVDRTLPPVLADDNRVQQILYNLVGNAIKFTEEGKVTVSATLSGSFMWVSVADTGIGIERTQRKKIFDAFEQADSSEERRYSGTGLGLAVTKQLVELHGGQIKMDSTIGEGSVFRFSLPLASAEPSVKPQAGSGHTEYSDDIGNIDSRANAPHNASHNESLQQAESFKHALGPSQEMAIAGIDGDMLAQTGNKVVDNEHKLPIMLEAGGVSGQFHILVVDDEHVNRQVLINLLSVRNYRVSECENGVEALALINNDNFYGNTSVKTEVDFANKIDLILLDVMMPGLSGFEVCRRIRETYTSSELPILFLTAKTQVDDLAKGYEVGANDFLSKPVEKKELFARVNKELKLLHTHRQLHEKHVELKHTQTQLIHAEKMTGLSTLVAGMAHAINNPTNMALVGAYNVDNKVNRLKEYMFDYIAQQESHDDETAKLFESLFNDLSASLGAINEGSRRIKSLVEGFRLFSHLNESDYSDVCLAADIQSCITILEATYGDTVEFVCDIHDDPKVNVQAGQLNQVFVNVIRNACQAIADKQQLLAHEAEKSKLNLGYKPHDDKIKLQVNTEPLPKGLVSVRLYIDSDKLSELVVCVSDDGVGMPDEVVGRIFEPFFTTRAVGEGTGLGMAVAFGIVEQHKGRVEISSRPGGGTKVWVHLPLKQ